MWRTDFRRVSEIAGTSVDDYGTRRRTSMLGSTRFVHSEWLVRQFAW